MKQRAGKGWNSRASSLGYRECCEQTVVTYEYATEWSAGDEPYYTVNDDANQRRYALYRQLADATPSVHFGGRLGEYRYYSMQDTVKSAWRSLDLWFGIRLPQRG